MTLEDWMPQQVDQELLKESAPALLEALQKIYAYTAGYSDDVSAAVYDISSKAIAAAKGRA